MKLSLSTVLVAAACVHSAAAVNIAFYTSGNCANAYFVCVNQSRDSCCDPFIDDVRYNSMEFQQLGTSQNVQLRSYDRGGCSRRTATSASNGRRTVCFVREPPYTGGGYGGFNLKRNAVEGGGADAECIRPQELGFPDGTKFNLTSLSDVDYAKIAKLSLEIPSDVPEQFQQLKITS
ncbi:hypothetical protein DM02DRAFT_730096 [Periconia macrospinosa]|uniref:Uncharacterized protein n=1 Tax=Periconia macrospinosa TaxID=97972 RepID=A0A2V1DLF4_9PLEO|nr:hypothetical protein DM02DRAFT_730096 [Periconia macrospinosa]